MHMDHGILAMALWMRTIGVSLGSLIFVVFAESNAASITLLKKDAVVWGQDQVIRGVITPPLPGGGLLYLNRASIPFSTTAAGDSFAVPLRVGEGTSTIVVAVDSSGTRFFSDTLRLTLGYRLRPDVLARAGVSGRSVTLHAHVLENPDSATLSFSWEQDPANPSAVVLSGTSDSTATFSLGGEAPPGEYYFTVTVVGGDDTVQARTIVTADSLSIAPFDLAVDHARWIDSAVVYCVTPRLFVNDGRLPDITAKIPELATLGVSALWLQPIYPTTEPEHGYHVTDHFKVRPSLGSDDDLRTLVGTAHAYGVRVLLDFVPNHTTVYHSYARDAIAHGPESHYFDFYQREKDSTKYSVYEKIRLDGGTQFVYYFWRDLVNLNYYSAEVRRMMIEAGRYWIEHFDIDGYRADVAWGVNSRYPEFFREWRSALKKIKPEVFLLAEEEAMSSLVFDEKFDAGYDWNSQYGWISGWAFGYGPPEETIFNSPNESTRVRDLRSGLTNGGQGFPEGAIIFRWLENNDTPRFRVTHDDTRTRMVAAFIFSLHGIPMLYNGLEIGVRHHPYSGIPMLSRDLSIRDLDYDGFFPFYQHLISLRRQFPALGGRMFGEVPVHSATTVFAYRRWEGRENVFGVINMGRSAANPVLQIPVEELDLDSTQTYYLTDVLSSDVFTGTRTSLAACALPMNPHTTRLLVLDTAAVATPVPSVTTAENPLVFSLAQNYPNPFNSGTHIVFTLPTQPKTRSELVTLTVYDLLGREVARLVDGRFESGVHEVHFSASHLASGVYFYTLRYDSRLLTRKMILMK